MANANAAVNSTKFYTETIWEQFQKAKKEGTPEGPMVSESELKKIWKDAQRHYKQNGIKDGRLPLAAVDTFEEEFGKLYVFSIRNLDGPTWMATQGALKYFNETIEPKLSESRIKYHLTEQELWGPR